MTESRYLQVFGDAIDALFRSVGVDERYRASARMFYTVETHITHQAEALVNESLYVTSQVLLVDDKRLQVFHRLHRAAESTLLATCEQMYLHVDTRRKKSCAIEPAVRAQLRQLAAAHASLPNPRERGRAVGNRAGA
jgi:carnitine 3-dehydrogenase